MAEHALQRVVQLVRDAGDELAERGELFRLHQAVSQLGALGFELHVRRDVARHEHHAHRFAFVAEQRRERHEKRAIEAPDRRFRPRAVADCAQSSDARSMQLAGCRADRIGERAIDQLVPRLAAALEKRAVDVDEPAVLVGDRHEIRERVERVLELSPRSQHGVEQQDVLDGAGQLAAHFVGALEQLHRRSRVEPDLLHHQRAERAPPPLERNRQRARVRRRRRCRRLRTRRVRAAGRPRPAPAHRPWKPAGSCARYSTSDEADSTTMRARRSWSQTDVRSAPNSRFAPAHNASSPAEECVDETLRENS